MELIDVIVGVGGAVVGGFSTFVLQNKREKRDDYSVLITTYQQLYNDVKKDQEQCAETSAKMNEELLALKSQINDLKYQLTIMKK